MPRFAIEPLGAHDRSTFACGVDALDEYLRTRASQDVKKLVASCLVALEEDTGTLAGYYTLAASSVRADELPPEIRKRLPRYPALPAALVGRLAVDREFRGEGLGSVLLADAALRVLKGDVKAFALVVEAKDDNAAAFYRHQGFRPFIGRPTTLFLPLGTIKKGAEAEGFS